MTDTFLTDAVRFQHADLLAERLRYSTPDSRRVGPFNAPLHELYLHDQTTFDFQRYFVDQTRIVHMYSARVNPKTGEIVYEDPAISKCGRTRDPETEATPKARFKNGEIVSNLAGFIPCVSCARALGHET
jgi:hypothetical protein